MSFFPHYPDAPSERPRRRYHIGEGRVTSFLSRMSANTSPNRNLIAEETDQFYRSIGKHKQEDDERATMDTTNNFQFSKGKQRAMREGEPLQT